MNVLELRNMIANMPEDAEIVIWVHERDNPSEGEAVNVHEAFITGKHGHDPDQTPAVHLMVLV
jgi:hypothetical protein